MKRSLAAIALTVVALTSLGTGCTRRQTKSINRIWRDSGGNVFNRVNINTASRADLSSLPGITDSDADSIIAHRPYGAVKGLLRKGALSKGKYEAIQDYVYCR